MQCPYCKANIPINKEYCPFCGKRVTVGFDAIAASVHDDASVRRGEQLTSFLRWSFAGLLIVGAVLFGLNDLWDHPLVYDGADLPAPDSPPSEPTSPGTILKPYKEIQPLVAYEGQAPRVFRYRLDPMRTQLRDMHGGSAQTGDAVRRGLDYLRSQQEPDGSWPVNTGNLRIRKEKSQAAEFQWARTGLTALALLAYLGEGETWEVPPGRNPGPYTDAIKRGIKYLMDGQDAQNGRFGPPDGNFMFNHALATQAVAEAAGLSGDPHLRAAAQRGIELIERTQGTRGGWGYRDQINQRQDTSVTAWAVQALVAAQQAGIKVNPEVLAKALKFLDEVTDPRTGTTYYGVEGQASGVPKQATPSYAGVVLMLRQELGENSTSPSVRLLARRTSEVHPRSKKEWGKDWQDKGSDLDKERALTFDPHRLYFATNGLFYFGGEDWVSWNNQLVPALLDMQDRDGSWRANDIWSVKVGATYSTALSVMTLQVYYRYH
ncbi:MAG: hypothetical protein KIS92_14055 [Planctomycetota bacterium]|nr:hypothetical protein [Planctomycetota bacterium]